MDGQTLENHGVATLLIIKYGRVDNIKLYCRFLMTTSFFRGNKILIYVNSVKIVNSN